MAPDHSRLGLEKKLGRIFKPTFYTYFTTHLRLNSTIYHTELGQCNISNILKKNCTQSIFRTINRGLLEKPFKTFSKLSKRPAAPHSWQAPNFQCELCRVFEWTLIELRFNIKNLFCFFFYSFITMCNLKKRLIRAAFWVLVQAMFMNDWKQTAQQLKWQERLLTMRATSLLALGYLVLPSLNEGIVISSIIINIYRENTFHSQRQVLKCL